MKVDVAYFNSYLSQLEQSLFCYRKDRQIYLNKLGSSLTTDDMPSSLLTIGHLTTILGYQRLLNDLEHLGYFSILPDFYQMDLPHPLDAYFEFGPPFTMRLKCPPDLIPIEIYKSFRQAQIQQLKHFDLDKKFDLVPVESLLNLHNNWYPIPIQMFGRLDNQAVDRVFLAKDGYFNLASRGGRYVLPGGGMLEKDLGDEKACKIIKVLEEYIEEERADFYLVAREYIAKIPKDNFKHQLLMALEDKKLQCLASITRSDGRMLLTHLAEKVKVFDDNVSLLLENLILDIDRCPQENLDSHELRVLRQLRAHLQVLAFRQTNLYPKAQHFIEKHAMMIQIPMFLDVRALGGKQISNTFIFKDKSLEQWFGEKLNCAVSAYGDDMTGASMVKLNFLEASTHHQKLGSHLLILLGNVLLVNAKHHLQTINLSDVQAILKQLFNELHGQMV
jgi:hypothetical protein